MQNIRMLKMAHKTSASDVDEPQIETRWQKPGNGKVFKTVFLTAAARYGKLL